MKNNKLKIEFVVEQIAPTAEQSDKWNKLFNQLFKKQKKVGESAHGETKNDSKRIYKTCGFIRVIEIAKQRVTKQKRERQIFMKGSYRWNVRYNEMEASFAE